MTQMSDFRNFVLRKSYEEARNEPAATLAIKVLRTSFAKPLPPHWVDMVIGELHASGLINLTEDGSAVRLTAQGAYEAEKLGGSFKTPAIARLVKNARNYERMGVILAGIGLIVAIITFAYPAYKEWQSEKSTAAYLEQAGTMSQIVQDAEIGMQDIEMAMEVDEFCKAHPDVSEYRGTNCEISRREREPTYEEARQFCLDHEGAFRFGNVDCAQFHK